MKGLYRPLFSKHPIVNSTGTCVPGFKLFVDVKGILHPCEEAPTDISIGDVKNGLNLNIIKELFIEYQKELLERWCRNENDTCSYCALRLGCFSCKLFMDHFQMKFNPVSYEIPYLKVIFSPNIICLLFLMKGILLILRN